MKKPKSKSSLKIKYNPGLYLDKSCDYKLQMIQDMLNSIKIYSTSYRLKPTLKGFLEIEKSITKIINKIEDMKDR